MAIKLDINSTSQYSFSVKTDGYNDGYFCFDKGDAYKPGIRYNYAQSKLQFSNNGTSYNDVFTGTVGGDLSGTATSATIDKIKGITVNATAPQDGYAYIYSQSANQWVPSKVNNSTIITSGKTGILSSGYTRYLLPNFCESTDENAIAFLAPIAGTLSNLVCNCSTAPGGTESIIITVRKNSVDTTITTSISGTSLVGTDSTHTVNLAAGDKVTIKNVVSAGSVARDIFVSLVFTVPTMNSAIVSGSSGGGSLGFGLYSAMPTAGTSGAAYIASDSPTAIWVDNSSEWKPIIAGSVVGKKPPLASAFTKLSSNAQTLTDNNGSLLYYTPSQGTSLVMRDFSIPLTSNTAFVEFAYSYRLPYVNTSSVPVIGIHMAESSTQKCYAFNTSGDGGLSVNYLERGFYASNYTRSSQSFIYPRSTIFDSSLPTFHRIYRSGSNIICALSRDLINWEIMATDALSSAFTSQPNYVGFFGIGYNGDIKIVITHFNYGSL